MSADPIKYLSEVDPLLNKVIEAVGKYCIKIRQDPFQSLIESIIYQQLAGAAASIIYERFIKYYNNITPIPSQILSTPDAILKCKVGLSSKKIEYLKDLSVRVADHRLDLKLLPAMTDEDIINLGRPDVLPVGDLGIRKAIQRVYSLPELPTPPTMLAISQPWKPYRSIATWYLWKSMSKFNSIG